jgi:hypothetical protein
VRRAVLLTAAACGTVALAASGWALAGPAGLLAAGICVTVAVLAALRWSNVPPQRRTPGPAPRGHSLSNADFALYRKVAGALSWGQVSARHFDHAFRPYLERITAALLVDRAGIDATADPGAAQALLGPELWALADPARTRSDDSTREPPSLDSVERLVRRLEEL